MKASADCCPTESGYCTNFGFETEGNFKCGYVIGINLVEETGAWYETFLKLNAAVAAGIEYQMKAKFDQAVSFDGFESSDDIQCDVNTEYSSTFSMNAGVLASGEYYSAAFTAAFEATANGGGAAWSTEAGIGFLYNNGPILFGVDCGAVGGEDGVSASVFGGIKAN